jgi:hypothetical protein
MKPRLATRTSFSPQARAPSDLLESPLKLVNGDLLGVPVKKKGIFGFPDG